MYRVTVTGAESTGRERVKLLCTFQESEDGETWVELEGAPGEMLLSLSAVRGALGSAGGEAEKRAALLELVRTAARSLPALVESVAVEGIEDLLPSGWPVTVAL